MTEPASEHPRARSRAVALALVAVVAIIGLWLATSSAAGLHHRLSGMPLHPRPGTDAADIQGWMTVPFVARRSHVPADEIYRAIGISPRGNGRRSLDDIAAGQRRDPSAVLATVRSTVTDYQRAHPTPPASGPAIDAPGTGPRGRGGP